jgi:hypothetical protein
LKIQKNTACEKHKHPMNPGVLVVTKVVCYNQVSFDCLEEAIDEIECIVELTVQTKLDGI